MICLILLFGELLR